DPRRALLCTEWDSALRLRVKERDGAQLPVKHDTLRGLDPLFPRYRSDEEAVAQIKVDELVGADHLDRLHFRLHLEIVIGWPLAGQLHALGTDADHHLFPLKGRKGPCPGRG